MKKLNHLVPLLFLMAAACASTGWQLHDEVESDSGNKVCETRMNRLPTVGASLVLDVRRITTPKRNEEYQFVATAGTAKTMLHIPAHEPSLFLDVDGKSYKFATPEKSGWTMGYNQEKVVYPNVPKSLVRELATAKSVKVRVIGSEARVESQFEPENKELVREFLTRYGT